MKDCPNCQALRDEIEVLNRTLGEDIAIPLSFRLTPSEGKLLRAIIARSAPISRDQSLDLVYTLALHEPDERIIDVFVSKARRKLKQFDIAIQTKWGSGWYMLPADKAKIAAPVAAERAVAA